MKRDSDEDPIGSVQKPFQESTGLRLWGGGVGVEDWECGGEDWGVGWRIGGMGWRIGVGVRSV